MVKASRKIVKCPKCGTDDLVYNYVSKAKCPKCGMRMHDWSKRNG